MDVYLLLVAMLSVGTMGTVLNKKFQMSLKTDFNHLLSYNLLNALFASMYFWVASGFKIKVNLVTLFFAIVFAVLIVVRLTLQVITLSKYSVAFCNILNSAGSIILPSLFGVLYFREAFSLRLICSIVLMLLAVILPMITAEGAKNTTVIDWKALLIGVLFFLSSAATVIWSKLYTSTPGMLGTSSYFLIVNAIMAVACGVPLIYRLSKTPKEQKSEILRPFSAKQVVNIGMQTAASNINSVLSIVLLARMDVSVYTIVTSSLTLIVGTLVSKFYFKEYVTWKNWASLVLAIVAIILK